MEIYTALCPVSFTKHNIYESHWCCMYSSLFLYLLLSSCSLMWIYHRFFNHFPTDEHLGYFQIWILWIKLQWTFLKKSFSVHKFTILLGKYLTEELQVIGYICMFSSKRDWQINLKSCTILHSHQQHFRVLVAPHLCQH